MWAAMGRMASRTLRLTEAQVAHGKDKVFQADQAGEVGIRIKRPMEKEKANLSDVKVMCRDSGK